MITIWSNLIFIFFCLQGFGNAFLIINQYLSVSCRVTSKTQSSQYSLLCIQGSCHAFVYIGSIYSKKVFFKLIFFICQFILNINKDFLAFVTFILGLNLEFSFQHSKCKKKHHLSLFT